MKQLNENELEKVNGGSNNVSWNDLENKINQIVNFKSSSNNISCNVRIIKVVAHCNAYYSRYNVYVYATDEQSYNTLKTKRFETDFIGLWGCDGIVPQDSGLGYGKNGFRIVFEDGADVSFYTIS